MTQRSVLEAVGVRKAYGVGTETETEILHGIDLVLGAGEMVALTGPSGAGKSTFLNVMGLLERPTSGRIVISGEDAGKLDEAGLTRLRGRSIGFIFQFHHLMPAFTALENVMMPILVDRGRPDAGMRERAAELLGKVGLGALLGRRPGKLSGGQQQRVAVARRGGLRRRSEAGTVEVRSVRTPQPARELVNAYGIRRHL